MKTGDIFSGFQLKKEEYIDEVKSVVRLFEHKKSGARLLHLENDDDNKVFSIAFKTPSYDDTGLPHILEHSVLCGSKNFSTKEPFVELIKSSLYTLLNAMTYPDKTVYPVGSRNEKDFFNLMNVYLDAVFYPNIYEKPEIFMQEGWHYNLENKKDRLLLNGVVYSEMKGYYSSPEGLLEEESLASLYSDTSYAYSYGGKPEVIPRLTYKKFLEFHRKYYHPSNSYIYLYGNGDIKKQLEFLDNKYLSGFENKKVDVSLGVQEPFKEMKEVNLKYSISKDDSSENKTYFSLNYACNGDVGKKGKFALGILMYYLMNTKSAPLKRALLDEDVGEDIFGHFEVDVNPPYITICVKNTSLKKKKKFLQVVNKTLARFVSEGLDKNLLKACFNIFEFNLREADYGSKPKGFFYNLNVLKTWIYGGDPIDYLSYKEDLTELRELLDQGYFEKLLEKHFLNNSHVSLVILKPEKGLLERKEKQLQDELDSYKGSLSSVELENLVKKTLSFKKYQNTPDSVKDIEKIPKLRVENISKEVEKISSKEEKVFGVSLLHNSLETNGISYLSLAFDTKIVPSEKLYALNILLLLLGSVATENYTREELDIFIQKYTGGCSFNREVFLFRFDDSKYLPKLLVRGKVLDRNFEKLVEIFLEIMNRSRFDDKKHIKEIIQESKSAIEMDIDYRGDDFTVKRVLSYFSDHGKYNEYVGGVSYYHYLCNLLNGFDEKWNDLKLDLEFLLKMVSNKSNLVTNIVCEEDFYIEAKKELSMMFSELKDLDLPVQKYEFCVENINEGLLTQNSVQNVAQGNNFKVLGYEFTGKLLVLNNVISREYLWNKLRVQGGAYGANCAFSKSGNTIFYSYRDPNLIRTLDVYEGVPKFLESFKTENIDKYIIGTIGALDSPLTARMKGNKSLAMYLSGVGDEDLQKDRDEVLSTTVEDIRSFSGLVRDLFREKYYCALGNEGELKRNKELFNSLVVVRK